ncbi:response regulator [Candidatus Falkowbacteria bacterium]|nr:response regulator [Candidatus Falkowbacteria bacterium]
MDNKILIVDDDASTREICKKIIAHELKIPKDNIFLAANAAEALQVLENNIVQFMITDNDMPGMMGIKLIQICLSKYPKMKVALMSACVIRDAAIKDIKFFEKPFDVFALCDEIKKALV